MPRAGHLPYPECVQPCAEDVLVRPTEAEDVFCGRGRRPGLRALGFRPPFLEEEVRQDAEEGVEVGAEDDGVAE